MAQPRILETQVTPPPGHRFQIYAFSLAFSKSSVSIAVQCACKAKQRIFAPFHMKTEQCERSGSSVAVHQSVSHAKRI